MELAQRIYRPETSGWYSVSCLSRIEGGWANAPLYAGIAPEEAIARIARASPDVSPR